MAKYGVTPRNATGYNGNFGIESKRNPPARRPTQGRPVEPEAPTPGGVVRWQKPLGPILFQGNHGPVAYRNITVMPLERLKAAKKDS